MSVRTRIGQNQEVSIGKFMRVNAQGKASLKLCFFSFFLLNSSACILSSHSLNFLISFSLIYLFIHLFNDGYLMYRCIDLYFIRFPSVRPMGSQNKNQRSLARSQKTGHFLMSASVRRSNFLYSSAVSFVEKLAPFLKFYPARISDIHPNKTSKARKCKVILSSLVTL